MRPWPHRDRKDRVRWGISGLASRDVSVVQGILLAISILVFVYLGIAMFKPDWF
jgi:F subunit of K+-transporting ATPase (Potass_KdpF)